MWICDAQQSCVQSKADAANQASQCEGEGIIWVHGYDQLSDIAAALVTTVCSSPKSPAVCASCLSIILSFTNAGAPPGVDACMTATNTVLLRSRTGGQSFWSVIAKLKTWHNPHDRDHSLCGMLSQILQSIQSFLLRACLYSTVCLLPPPRKTNKQKKTQPCNLEATELVCLQRKRNQLRLK